MNDLTPTLYVDTEQGLRSFCGIIAGQPWLALDTEFMREDTYYPRLCLLQIAIPGTVACIDPIALPRLDPLLDVIDDPAITKVLHASHQDMEIFFHLRGTLPGPVFDTQIAAPLLGLPAQASYAALVKEIMGEHLEKAHTRTDWSRRPLSPEQLVYAADDVRFLGPLYLALRERLAQCGRLDWLHEDFAAVCEPARYSNCAEDAWKRIRGTQRMSGRQLAILQALAAWREETARAEDKPRGWLVRDDAMIELALLAPSSLDQLAGMRNLRRQTVARYGDALLTAVTIGSRAPELRPSRGRPAPLTKAEEGRFARMASLVQARAAEVAIDPTVLASRNDMVDLIRGNASCRLLTGWRREAIGEDLISLE